MDDVRLVVNGWTPRTEREEKLANIRGELPGVEDGTVYYYRGLQLERKSIEDSRQRPLLVVRDPSGEYRGEIQPADHRLSELVELLDDVRNEWVNQRRAEAL